MARVFRTTIAAASLLIPGCGQTPTPGEHRERLDRLWTSYKEVYIHPDGYVLDPSRNGGEVTSEGQGYALLRAAFLQDEPTFTRVYAWTKRQLERPDGLYSWRWTPVGGGRLLDRNTAADADQEMALALLLAAEAFDAPGLRADAVRILTAIRALEALDVGPAWVPAAGNWAVADRVTNPSYFLPYAYPYFAHADPNGHWELALDGAYRVLTFILRQPGVALVPDFLALNGAGEPGTLPLYTTLSGDFSSDSMRVFWRVAVDCALHARARACADPLGVQHLQQLLARDGQLFTRYAPTGAALEHTPSLSFYGAAAPYLLQHAPTTGRAVLAHLSADTLQRLLARRDAYYDANWVWFGLAAIDGLIVDRLSMLPHAQK